MKTNAGGTWDYVLGNSKREIQRLIQQAASIGPVTERLWSSKAYMVISAFSAARFYLLSS